MEPTGSTAMACQQRETSHDRPSSENHRRPAAAFATSRRCRRSPRAPSRESVTSSPTVLRGSRMSAPDWSAKSACGKISGRRPRKNWRRSRRARTRGRRSSSRRENAVPSGSWATPHADRYARTGIPAPKPDDDPRILIGMPSSQARIRGHDDTGEIQWRRRAQCGRQPRKGRTRDRRPLSRSGRRRRTVGKAGRGREDTPSTRASSGQRLGR